jgi:hypothetical protein
VLDDVFMGCLAESYPHDAWLDIGGDGIAEWSISGEFRTAIIMGGLEKPLNGMLKAAAGNGSGNLTVPVVLHSATAGILRLSNLSIDYDMPPVISSSTPAAPNLSILETESQLFSVSAQDPDNDRLVYTWRVNALVVGTGDPNFTFKTNYTSAGTYDVMVSVSDMFFTVNRSWTVTVRDLNRLPAMEWHPESDVRMNETETVSFWVSGEDPDGGNITVTWLLDGVFAGDGTTFDYATDYNSSGIHGLAVNVSDGIGTVVHGWNITVINRNRPPQIRSVAPPSEGYLNLKKGAAQTFTVDAYDPDNDALVYVWKLNSDVVPNISSGRYECRKGLKVGQNTVRVEVSDGNATVAREWAIRVTTDPGQDTVEPGLGIAIWIAIACLIVIVVLVAIMRSRRKPGKGAPSAGVSWDPEEGTDNNINN